MIIDNFITPLGTVDLNFWFENDDDADLSEFQTSKIIESVTLLIEIIAFDDISNWIKDSVFAVKGTKGWIIRITKKAEGIENLKITCELKTADLNIVSGPDGGENLDAILIENKTHFLSIGTEDGEMLKRRAEKNDYMPTRFAEQLGYHSKKYSFTEYLDLGFKTIVPELRKDEKLYFHYLIATNSGKKSTENTDEDGLSTHFAVDFSKRTLIDKLEITE